MENCPSSHTGGHKSPPLFHFVTLAWVGKRPAISFPPASSKSNLAQGLKNLSRKGQINEVGVSSPDLRRDQKN